MTKRTMWTPEELDTLRLMYGLGVKYEEIARVLDRTPSACMQRASMMGIVRKRGKPLPVDVPAYTDDMAEIPEDLGYSLEATPRKPWWRRLLNVGG